jgi:hypothetical protein
VWENKVVDRILHNMSLLMERSFSTVQELNRFRKELTQRLGPPASGRTGAAGLTARGLPTSSPRPPSLPAAPCGRRPTRCTLARSPSSFM